MAGLKRAVNADLLFAEHRGPVYFKRFEFWHRMAWPIPADIRSFVKENE